MSKMGQELIAAVQEALDDAEGKIELRTTRLNISPVAEKISAEEIKGIRKELGMTQGAFATVIGVSRKTVESWEIGRYTPDGAARRLISVMQKDHGFPERYGIVHKGSTPLAPN
jgi:putative transcriptional regulator